MKHPIYINYQKIVKDNQLTRKASCAFAHCFPQDGEEWKEGACKQCACADGFVECETEKCHKKCSKVSIGFRLSILRHHC